MPEDVFHLGIKGLVRNNKGEILLLKVNLEELHGYTGEAYWDLPGGRIHRGGTVEETLRREIEEETGIAEIAKIEPVGMVLSNIRIPQKSGGDVGLILAVYSCQLDHTQPIRLSFEHTEARWFSPNQASELLQVKYPPEFIRIVALLRE